MKLAIIGDIGGHYRSLVEALVGLGVDVAAACIPEDITICQVGDLIHRGPDSPAVIALVDRLLTNNPGRWIQLAGNHEAQYLFPPRFQWPEVLDATSVSTLRRWWQEGSLVLAASFLTSGVEVRRPGGIREQVGAGELLVTHAGLTPGLWQLLGAPTSAREAKDQINAQRFDEDAPVWAAGAMLLGGPPERRAGVVWAEAAGEVYRAWSLESQHPGFHQAHGHSSALWWNSMNWSQAVKPWRRSGASVEARITADFETKIVRAEIRHNVFWGVDPGHGVHPQHVWSPLVLE